MSAIPRVAAVSRSRGALLLLLTLAFAACTPSRYVAIPDLNAESSVKVLLHDGNSHEGIVVKRTGADITLVSQADNEPHLILLNDIRRVERSDKTYDYRAHPISDAEIQKHKGRRNTWVYAAGGGTIGALAGLAVGIPIWLANDNPPPYFVAGISAVVGSIYFAARGMKKDHSDAVHMVRLLRERDGDLEAEQQSEKERLEAIRREKEELMKKLNEKKVPDKNEGRND